MKHFFLFFTLSLLFFTSFSQKMNSEGQYIYGESEPPNYDGIVLNESVYMVNGSVLSDVDYIEVSINGWSVVYAKSNFVIDDNFNWIPLIRHYSRMENYSIRTMTKEDYLKVADDLLPIFIAPHPFEGYYRTWLKDKPEGKEAEDMPDYYFTDNKYGLTWDIAYPESLCIGEDMPSLTPDISPPVNYYRVHGGDNDIINIYEDANDWSAIICGVLGCKCPHSTSPYKKEFECAENISIESNPPHELFEYTLYIDVPITEYTEELIMSLDGVESTTIMSKYQLWFDIGKFFDESEVSDLIINTLTCKNE